MKIRPLQQSITLLVCTRDRGKKEDCCARSGSEKLLSHLKKRVKERKLQEVVRVVASGCIDKCSKGPNVLIFPGSEWACRVGTDDVDTLLDEALARSQAVAPPD